MVSVSTFLIMICSVAAKTSKKPQSPPTIKPTLYQPTVKPTKYQPSQKPVKNKPIVIAAPIQPSQKPVKVTTIKPTKSAIQTVYSDSYAKLSDWYPQNKTDGIIQQEFFSCKNGATIFSFFGHKINIMPRSLGIQCGGGSGTWKVMGAFVTAANNRLTVEAKATINTLTVYKYLEPTLQKYVVSGFSVCYYSIAVAGQVCKDFGNLNPLCSSAGPSCLVETTTDPLGGALDHWYFKTLTTSVATLNTPGYILDMKVASGVYPAATVGNLRTVA